MPLNNGNRLIEGRYMRCPRCRKLNDILLYKPMQSIDEFAQETMPVYKCPNCKWLFAPANNALAQIAGEDT